MPPFESASKGATRLIGRYTHRKARQFQTFFLNVFPTYDEFL